MRDPKLVILRLRLFFYWRKRSDTSATSKCVFMCAGVCVFGGTSKQLGLIDDGN